MAKFYITWELLTTRIVTEEIEADDFDAAENHARARYATGLVHLTEALGPSMADGVAEMGDVDEITHAKLRDNLGPSMTKFVRILVPTHQITRVAVATVPINQKTDLADYLSE